MKESCKYFSPLVLKSKKAVTSSRNYDFQIYNIIILFNTNKIDNVHH